MRTVLLGTLLVATAWIGPGAATSARAQSAELPTFHIVARAGRFTPPRIEVPAGQRVKLTLQNDGAGPLEFENLDLRIEKVLSPGARSFVVLPKLAPGQYRFVDEFNADKGELNVIAK